MEKIMAKLKHHGSHAHVTKLTQILPLEIIKLSSNWHWETLSNNRNITWEYILANLDKKWNWCTLCFRYDFKFEYINLIPPNLLQWHAISANSNITWEIINSNPDLPWEWDGVSKNYSITIDIINKNRDLSRFKISSKNPSWDWYSITRRQDITFDDVISFPTLLWDWFGIINRKDMEQKMYKNLNIVPDIYLEKLHFNNVYTNKFWLEPRIYRKWNWFYLTKKIIDLDIEFINKYNVKWDYDHIINCIYLYYWDLRKLEIYKNIFNKIFPDSNILTFTIKPNFYRDD